MIPQTNGQSAEEPLPSNRNIPIIVDYGEGLGKALMEACLEVLQAAGAEIAIQRFDSSAVGDLPAATYAGWNHLHSPAVIYRAPSFAQSDETVGPVDPGLKYSLNLFANIVPCTAYAPTATPGRTATDVVIICPIANSDCDDGKSYQLNEEQKDGFQSLHPDDERSLRYSLAFCRANGRKKIAYLEGGRPSIRRNAHWSNALANIPADYPEIEPRQVAIDEGIVTLVETPNAFDVAVVPSAHGDLLFKVATRIAGCRALTPSVLLGERGAIFQAFEGGCPLRDKTDYANPSGVLLAGVMMLSHIGQTAVAERVYGAWLRTIQDGVHTHDLFYEDRSRQPAGTKAFAKAVIDRLKQPAALPLSEKAPSVLATLNPPLSDFDNSAQREIAGIDVFVKWSGNDPKMLAQTMGSAANSSFRLAAIANQGIEAWPNRWSCIFFSAVWQCRYLAHENKQFNEAMIVELLRNLVAAGVHAVKTENLYADDAPRGTLAIGALGISRAQGLLSIYAGH